MPKSIEFEGTRHEFPDDFSDADIQKALKQTHGKPSSQFVSGAPAETGPKSPPPIESTKPTGGKRFLQGIGVPSSKEEAQTMVKEAKKYALIDAVAPGGRALYGIGKNVVEATRDVYKEGKEAGINVAEGGPVAENLGKVGYGVVRGAAKALSPLGAEAVQTAGEDIAHGDKGAAAGGMAAAVVNYLLLRGGKGSEYRENKISYAANTMPDAVKTALPDLDRVIKETGHPKTIGDLHDKTQSALTTNNNEYSLGLQPIRENKVAAHPISDAIKSHITSEMEMTPEGRQEAKMLIQKAADYEKPWTIEQLDQKRRKATGDLTSFRHAKAENKRAKVRSDVDIIVATEVEAGTKDIVYSAMDRANKKPAGYYRNLQQRQSSLLSILDDVKKNAERLTKEHAIKEGGPIFGNKVRMSMVATPGSGPHPFIHQPLRGADIVTANKAVRQAFPGFGRSALTAGRKASAYSLPLRMLAMPDVKNLTPLPEPSQQ